MCCSAVCGARTADTPSLSLRDKREREVLSAYGQLSDANVVCNEHTIAVMKRMSDTHISFTKTWSVHVCAAVRSAEPGSADMPSPPRRETRERELLSAYGQLGDANEVLNERAVAVMKRMSDKLTGRDFLQVEQPCFLL